ncbi:MAG: ATP-dependent RecD-like DNA helicase [Clostridiales bacterium]|nr:ATP-dependent RecD-like DNA helicase [Clostridiales bacterium]
MKIEGPIEEIIFRNEQNGYTVFILDFKSTPVVCVGKLLNANIGENLELVGEYVNNAKYGYQFSFNSYEITLPTSLAGIERYLSSGLIKGVGPITAKNIVKHFKEQTFDIIEMSPTSLAEVKNISLKKALEIGEKFKELKKLQNSVMFLQKYNISTNMALKIYDIYGAKTIDIVKTNPYRLVEDVNGIGFTTADKIAGSIGIPSDSEFRVRAGIVFTLQSSIEKTGNTYLPKNVLLTQASQLLDIDLNSNEKLYQDALDNLTIDKSTLCLFHDGQEIVTPAKYHHYETVVSQKLALLNNSVAIKPLNIEDEITHFEERFNIAFHSEQKNAIKTAINSGISVITGGPGTGKTTIIKCIIEILKSHDKRFMLLAPTGRASKRMSDSCGEEAKTIHRALEVASGELGNINRFVYNENNNFKTDVVIVDEVSMVDVALMSHLCKALPRDCQLILVGDKDQLPSVGAGNVLDDIIKSGIIPLSMLTKIYRQSDDSLIITNAHLINNGKMPHLDNSSKDFFFQEHSDLGQIKATIIDMVVRRLPKFTGLECNQIQVLAPLKAGVCGIDNLNRTLQESINPPAINKMELTVGETIFRVGDKVMQTTNNYGLIWKKTNGIIEEEGEGVFNGDIGFIELIDFQTNEMVVMFEDGRRCLYPRTEINQLSLAYAITIHKSQGSEFDVVIIPIIAGTSMILTRNLIYTAVTRAKKMVVLVGEQKNLKRMVSNSYTVQRFTLLKSLIISANKKVKDLFN